MKNIEDDKLIHDDHLAKFRGYLNKLLSECDDDANEAEMARIVCTEMIQQTEFESRPVETHHSPERQFARVESLEVLQHIWEEFRAPPPLLEKLTEKIIAGKATPKEVIRDTANAPMCDEGRLMWVWFDPTVPGPPPQVNDSRGELVCRLGLTQYAAGGCHKDHELVCWAHCVDENTEVRRPTGFDAFGHEQWRPGGKTRPIGDDKTDYGLHEALHPSVRSENLTTPINYLGK